MIGGFGSRKHDLSSRRAGLKRMNIVLLDRDTIGPTVELTRPAFEHRWTAYGKTAASEVVERLADADIAITNKVPIRREAMEKLPKLRMIAVAATGYNMLDADAARERGIVISNVRGYAVNTVPEHTFALIFALRRSIVGYRQDVIGGEWQRSGQFCFFNHPIRDLAGSTLGIIGAGALGQSVAAIGRALGMRVLFAAHKGEEQFGSLYTSFDAVLERSDIITLHTPLTPATRNMIGTAEFEKMRQRPLLINTARGGLVDEAELVQALDRGLVGGIGFDVLTEEPPNPANPLLAVLERPNVIVTPHVAWASEEAMSALWGQVIGNIENFARGEPTNAVG